MFVAWCVCVWVSMTSCMYVRIYNDLFVCLFVFAELLQEADLLHSHHPSGCTCSCDHCHYRWTQDR